MLWNMKVAVTSVVTRVLGMVPKSLVRRLEELEIKRKAETIQTTALLKSARLLRRKFEETCGHLDSCERPSANTDVKISPVCCPG